MINSRTFILGEERYVDFMVCSKDPEEYVVITDARYTLLNHKTKEIESEGVCEIDGRCLRILLSPQKRGIYHLIVTAEAPPEKMKAVIDVVVKERD